MQAFRFLNIGVRIFKLLALKVVSVCCNSLSVDHNVRRANKVLSATEETVSRHVLFVDAHL